VPVTILQKKSKNNNTNEIKRIKSSLSKSSHFSVVSRSSPTNDFCSVVCSGKQNVANKRKKKGRIKIQQSNGWGKKQITNQQEKKNFHFICIG